MQSAPCTPSLRIVICSYEVRAALARCLRSIERAARRSPRQKVRVSVVDNASQDGSVAMLKRDFRAVQTLALSANLGFGAACNRAAARASEEFLLFLNPDTELPPDFFQLLSQSMQLPHAAAVGLGLREGDGRWQLSVGPPPILVLDALRGRWQRALDRRDRSAQALLDRWVARGGLRRVSWVSGAALLVRRPLFEAVGGFNEKYFLYFEDTDLCLRLAKLGYIYFDPRVQLTHHRGLSAKGREAAVKQRYRASQARFWRSWGGDWQWWMVRQHLRAAGR